MVSRKDLPGAQRIVIKVGTSTLTYANGKLNLGRIESLVRQLADLHNADKEVILVSSGAIGAGADKMGFKKTPRTIPEKQALAAIGQGALLHMYEKLFAEYGKTVAQVLLTRDDFMERLRYLNATNALLAILALQVIPIINENDTVVVEEIKFGDNDTLSALVAGITDAGLLIILSDVDGLYNSDPRLNQGATLQKTVAEITEDMEKSAGTKGSKFSSGGMLTKLNAARICMAEGVPMVIANGSHKDVIRKVVNGQDIGTLFVPRVEKMQARKRWIAFGSAIQGRLYIDAGALNALVNRGKSLLPSGIIKVADDFDRGAVVAVLTAEGQEVARGMVNYNSEEIKLIAGRKTSDIGKILSAKDYDEVIHRNNLWVK